MDTRTRILMEGSALMQELGLPGLTMRKLAARVGITATALYRHFESKGDLVVAVCTEGFQRFGHALWKALSASTPLQRLADTTHQYKAFSLENPNFYRVMFLSSAENLKGIPISAANQQRYQATFVFLVDRVKECLSTGTLAPGDAEALASIIWANCHGLVALRLNGQLSNLENVEFDRLYSQSCKALLRGLQAV